MGLEEELCGLCKTTGVNGGPPTVAMTSLSFHMFETLYFVLSRCILPGGRPFFSTFVWKNTWQGLLFEITVHNSSTYFVSLLPLFPFSHSFSFSFLCLDAKSYGLLVFCFYLSRASYGSPWRLALAVVLGHGMMGERERRSWFEKDG